MFTNFRVVGMVNLMNERSSSRRYVVMGRDETLSAGEAALAIAIFVVSIAFCVAPLV